ISEANFVLAIFSRARLYRADSEADTELAQLLNDPSSFGSQAAVIPVRIDDYRVPDFVSHLVWVDVFEETGWPRLVEALRSTPRLPKPEPARELVDACLSGDCVLYAGAGFSAPVGYPVWRPFMESLLKWAGSKSLLAEPEVEKLRNAVRQGELD